MRTDFCLEAISALGNLLPGLIYVVCCNPMRPQLLVAAPVVKVLAAS